MLLPICLYGHPVLRKQARPVDIEGEELATLIADMFETMYHAEGVGLAAPQIGKSIRLFVIDSAPFREADEKAEIYKGAFINPEIMDESGDDFTFNEGCLSLPDIHEEITRKSEVTIRYTDENGHDQLRKFNGYVARIIQHEYDHLQGQVFTDKVTSLKKMLLKRKLSDIANGKVHPRYKSKIK